MTRTRARSGKGSGATVQFLGAAGTVTGSKHLVDVAGDRVLLDCGLFQGLKALRERNWQKLPFDVESLDAVLVSHAHIDHSGALPLLVKQGFRGPIHCTPGTADLLDVMLLDAAHIQEEDARFANRHGFSKHSPALPLYTTADAEQALSLLDPCPFGEDLRVTPRIHATFRHAGHILGSASIALRCGEGAATRRLVFSGDLGRFARPILNDPETVEEADVLLVESTYGNRLHPPDPSAELARLVREAAERRSVIVVPAFAVDRTQELLYALRDLEERGLIPEIPVVLDSPMAVRVTGIYARHGEEHDPDMQDLSERGEGFVPRLCRRARTAEESIALNDLDGPMMIVSASGMATGGRVLHHLARRLPDANATVLLVGYQAAGTRGRALVEGARSVRIHGREVPVRSAVTRVEGFSAHADQAEILRWLGGFARPPAATYCVHGEPQAADTLAAEIRHRLGWNARVAEDRQVVPLGP